MPRGRKPKGNYTKILIQNFNQGANRNKDKLRHGESQCICLRPMISDTQALREMIMKVI